MHKQVEQDVPRGIREKVIFEVAVSKAAGLIEAGREAGQGVRVSEGSGIVVRPASRCMGEILANSRVHRYELVVLLSNNQQSLGNLPQFVALAHSSPARCMLKTEFLATIRWSDR